MLNLAAKLVGKRSAAERKTIQVTEPSTLVNACYWAETTSIRLEVPVEWIVMQGGYNYATNHPFVRALASGKEALAAFYTTTQPKTLAELHRLPVLEDRDVSVPAWEIPWYLRSQRLPPPGEGGLGQEHGVSFYGPVTEQKLELEMKRLVSVRNAIREKGYQPDRYGDIEGYVLNAGDDARFFVRGKHRAAALSSLGHKVIPVCFRTWMPRQVFLGDARNWPLVQAGSMSENFAIAVFRAYFR